MQTDLESTISLTYICSRFWIFDKKRCKFLYTKAKNVIFFAIFDRFGAFLN